MGANIHCCCQKQTNKKEQTKKIKTEREKDGEDGKEKPEGHTSFPDRSSLSLVGHSITRERAWCKGKKGCTHGPVHACG